ncbi:MULTISPECIES: ead/Ea22-like family protein [Citrobacter]|uniref:ead/Ea22-like family protein n=1 Tax=Citrobacter TaxID=544 RepID=UPI0015E92956|nr:MULTISPECIES: ead/Ea22-like family protein [Citrobacter]MDE9677531.1 ead/Ea22-like family protein [Citrobacter portucalensis]MDM2784668.1 ead/Ea22-like family protein [Citrobacter sp. Cpo137]QLS99592.1 ead/Ea22-like family protein [Citrobacter freundii]QLT04167.1 ead/Ea22-like family protein [Citrobacter freundii]
MTALNKQALRQLATDAHELGIIKRYTKGIEANKRFAAIATPFTFLALLDELEDAEKRIAELEARTVTVKLPADYRNDDGSINDDMFNTCAVVGAFREALSAAGIGVKGE